jgi:hypothetical protein
MFSCPEDSKETVVAPLGAYPVKGLNSGLHWFLFNLTATISWIILVVSSTLLFSWPITSAYLHAKISEYKAVESSIQLARVTRYMSDYELRGIQVTIAEWNGWLAFWNSLDSNPIIDLYIPEEIHNLKPME